MLKIGYKVGPEQFPPLQMLDQIIAAEKNGFESIDVSDHFHPGVKRGRRVLPGAGLELQP